MRHDAGTGGTLTVSDGTHTAQIDLDGQYAAAGLQADAAGTGRLLAYDAPAADHTLLGGAANDILVGGDGNDILWGAAGADTLTGGNGSDAFVFKAGDASLDTVMDFSAGAGGDKLDVLDLLIGYSGTAGDFMSLGESGGNTILSVDRDGTGGTYGFQDVVVLHGQTGLNLDTLVTQGNILTA